MNWKVGNPVALLSIKWRRVVILVITTLGILAACVSSATPGATPDNALISPTQPILSSTIVPTNPVLQCSLSLEELLKEPVLDYATHRTDNDISFSDESIGLQVLLPQVVIEKIHEVAREHFRQYELEYVCTKLADVYGSVIYEVDIPQHQQLFILKLTKPPGVFTYRPILFDPVQNQVTVTPPTLWGSPACGTNQCISLEAPYVSFDDINQDGEKEIVFQRQAHNGTFNAAQYIYYDIAPDLALTTIFVLETRIPYPQSSRSTQIYMRDVQKLKPNQLKVETYLLETTTGAMIDDLGFVILEAVDDASAFRVISKTVTAPDNKDELVTFMPFEENDFLKGVIRSVTE